MVIGESLLAVPAARNIQELVFSLLTKGSFIYRQSVQKRLF